MGTVENSVFNHSCIRIDTWDVKIDKVYVWSMTCEFGIGIYNGAGNTTITNTDIVPPLVSTTYGIAGIYIDGITGAALNTKMIGAYLDGNPGLDTRQGIYVGPRSGATLMSNINANRMDSDCIVIDTAYNVVLDGYSGHSNNNQGRGSREIFITRTGTQTTEKIRLSNVQCLMTAAVVGTAAPAIEVHSSVSGSEVSITGFNIKQPGAGGGYSSPEVKVDSATTHLSGTGQLSKYNSRGVTEVASGATGATITLSSPYPMAYQPLASDVSIIFTGTVSVGYRIQFTNANTIFVAFASALTGAGQLNWSVDLHRQ